MKKLFFTAIALIAFSGVSMANTISEEEVKTNEQAKTNEQVIRTNSLCEYVAQLQATNTYNQTGDANAANMSYILALTSCILGL